MENWEFNVLGIYNYNLPGKLDDYFKFIGENHNNLEGYLIEAGVFNGKSILATGLLLKELGSTKKVYGFDSFSGFPPVYHEKDEFFNFEKLYKSGSITQEHLSDTVKLREYRKFLSGQEPTLETISNSGDFSDARKDLLMAKIEYLDLTEYIELVPGNYSDTMTDKQAPKMVSAALVDCDLYMSYKVTLPFIWNRLVRGGYVFLDEYYSLKFPGARMATNEYFDDKSEKPEKYLTKPNEFERWFVKKI